ncbi:MAG: glycosyltransferase [Bacteroidetes bacterium]|nr:glycosyltransferase [Bacteroidota bacterium]
MGLQIIFWVSVLLIFHSYLFYPLLLKILSSGKKGNQDVYDPQDDLPMVSIIISAFNEEEVIDEKIRSVFASSYPQDRLEMLIGSDCSGDNTDSIISNLANEFPSLRFFPYKQRRGKQNVVNDLVNESKGSILILSDANVMFSPGTVFNLVKHFRNPRIGLVDSNMINRGQKKEGISIQESSYISREVWIKNMEGRLWGSMMGPFGGCYAIRRMDYSPVPPNYLVDDFYINMKVFEQGKMAINDLDATVFEDVSSDLGVEIRRKTRIATGNFQNLITFYGLLFRKNVGFCFLSHKVIRWFGPWLIILALLSSLFLATGSIFYLIIFCLQLGLLAIPFLDYFLKKAGIHNRFLRLITHFYAMNLALMLGFFRVMKPVRSGVWDRTKRNQ